MSVQKTPATKQKKIFSKHTPPEGVTLEMMILKLVDNYGWDRLGKKIPIKCFNQDPSVGSSLKFLRRTPWARLKVEMLYAWRDRTGWDPRDNDK